MASTETRFIRPERFLHAPPGAVFPLIRTEEETRLNTQLVGQVAWLGAWGRIPDALSAMPLESGKVVPKQEEHGPWDVPPLREGAPHLRPLDEDAAHFLIRQVRAHPHQVTIYAAGPLTNIALALAIEPHFAELTRGIVHNHFDEAMNSDRISGLEQPDYTFESMRGASSS